MSQLVRFPDVSLMSGFQMLSQRASMITKEQAFLENDAPCNGMHFQNRLASTFLCFINCWRGKLRTFADSDVDDDVEAQLLKPGHVDGVKAIKRMNPNTAQGLENISVFFRSRTTALKSIVSNGLLDQERHTLMHNKSVYVKAFF
jgi:hypothetical protein